MKLSEIDRNFAVETQITAPNIAWINATDAIFRLYGLMAPTEKVPYYHRVTTELADAVSPVVAYLNHHTTGGRLRFITDSRYVAIHTKQSLLERGPISSLCNVGGFDLFSEEDGRSAEYVGTFVPPYDMQAGYESIVAFPDAKPRLLTINFPLYGGVEELLIGLERDATLTEAPEYGTQGRIVYYGSSITQGACAGRPGSSYESMIGRALDMDFLNLGFSGNAKGEPVMAEYIAGLPMRAFVLDYDYNAPTVDFLRQTHEPFYKAVRAANPTLPILMTSRPKRRLTPEEEERRLVVTETYEKAVAAGDRNVWLLDGRKYFDTLLGESATVDTVHPTDYGFARMAEVMLPVLREMLGIRAE